MTAPSDFWATRGSGRYTAVLLRYDQQQIGAKVACEYLAELLPLSGELDVRAQGVVEAAHLLVHEAFDGLDVADSEFQQVLAQR